ncbi:NLPA lipoprotein [Lachnospiraceae bacterium TWA4]|nr:NLPA lipoprotein [Lachnospiraceae bacterium TWA4]
MLEASNDDVQIQLVKFNAWTDLTDALSAGKIDGASVLVELAMNIVNNGIDLKAIGLGHKDGNVVVVSNDIKSASDLKGKTFAIPSAQSSHNILLNDLLKQAGMTREDLKIIQLSPTEMPSSLVSHAIDGYCVAEPYGAQIIAKDLGHVLYESSDLWEDSACCAFVLHQSLIDSNKEAANTIISKYFEAGNLLDTKTSMAIAEKYLGQETKTLEQSLAWISYKNLELTQEEYNVLCDKVKAYGINENPPTYEKFVYSLD